MNEKQLCESTLSDLAEAVYEGSVSPVDLVQLLLERIENVDGKLNTYVTLLKKDALKEAEQLQRELHSGRHRGPLHGIPFGVKDVLATKGVRTTAGSKIFAGFIPDYDATSVERLKSAGGILLGKLNTHELALGASTDNPLFGATKNPWDTSRIPGGSSGGSAAAIAASLCFASLGTDGGGSVRIPASLCGVTGLKATYGRVSRHGVTPLHWSLEHVAPITKTAEDAAIILKVISGRDSKDPTSSSHPVPDYVEALSGELEGIRAGYISEYTGEAVDEDVDRSFKDALHVFEKLGISIDEVSIPYSKLTTMVMRVIINCEGACLLWDKIKNRAGELEKGARMCLETGAIIRATDYLKAQQLRTVIVREMRKIFKTYDLLLSPTTPTTASKAGEMSVILKRARAIEENLTEIFARFTCMYNVTGLPAISIPCGFDQNGLPIGLQIAAGAFEEDLVLKAAHAYQTRTDWHKKQPAI